MSRVKLLAVGAAALAVGVATLAARRLWRHPNHTDPPQSTSTPVTADREYSGVGSQIIGTLTFPTGADAAWTSTRGLFMLIAINAPASAQLIVSKEASGTDYVPGRQLCPEGRHIAGLQVDTEIPRAVRRRLEDPPQRETIPDAAGASCSTVERAAAYAADGASAMMTRRRARLARVERLAVGASGRVIEAASV